MVKNVHYSKYDEVFKNVKILPKSLAFFIKLYYNIKVKNKFLAIKKYNINEKCIRKPHNWVRLQNINNIEYFTQLDKV